MKRHELQEYLDDLLLSARIKDYCPNGLQVEGREDIRRVVCGVTASQALIDQAVALQADAILVHHGWFWRGEDGRVTGFRRKRLASLLAADINLFAYHLPLDLHPQLGNNAQLAALLGWQISGRCGDQDLIFLGDCGGATTAGELAQSLAAALGRTPMLIGDPQRSVKRVAWCTGAAQSSFEQAILAGADLYLSGEISEPTVHLARESGVAYLAAGHHATERYGVKALGTHLAERFGLQVDFLDVDNPV
ncbi:Nif3-like dinuclear metal center hexameric protein [Uliginosibacterium sediminicola]|uniref:Nif3-like dinuclear metal center hexameric protein n=1 Tax=Uliginosibacterium sediminicola TaxID=2024550 RepID=A0ABU9YYT8_9RHOO